MPRFSSLTLLGSTGSIGRQALDVLRHLGGAMRLAGISSGGGNVPLLAAQICEFRPAWAHIGDTSRAAELRALLGDWRGELVSGDAGLERIATEAPADLVLVATVGWTGLPPALAALRAGRHLALANKEVLVCGGHLVMDEARRRALQILPVDSEHNAIHQCIQASPGAHLRRMILTCSGGPFRESPQEEIDAAMPERTLRHPKWNMGSKITVDSATLMNKGFEVIEAHHLFGIDYPRIEVIVHPQSIVHSMVEFVDGSIIAQLGPTDMRLPIQYALTWPDREPTPLAPLDLATISSLTFSQPDRRRFPCLDLAYAAGAAAPSAPCVLNAANEVAVALHLDRRIPAGAIPRILSAVMERHTPTAAPTLDDLREWDAWGRAAAREAHEASTPDAVSTP